MYIECSALDGDNIEDIFAMASKNILKKVEEGQIDLNKDTPTKKLIDFKSEPQDSEEKKAYCQSC